jgi:flagellar biosynthesis protein FliP
MAPIFLTFLVFFLGDTAMAADSLPSLMTSVKANGSTDASTFLTLQNQIRIIGFLSIISLIPVGVMMMTSFTRITIVFQFLRQALGSSQVPSNQIIIGLSIILTGFVMQPVIQQVQQSAFNPYLKGTFKNLPEVKSGVQSEESVLFEKAWKPLRNFLMSHVREKDLELFLDIAQVKLSGINENSDEEQVQNELNAIPWYCLIPAFVLSELRVAFMMGFLLFLPFLIIDMVVASVLMSMGMMMLPPVMVSTPFKLLLFIMIDGWRIIVYQLIKGYH